MTAAELKCQLGQMVMVGFVGVQPDDKGVREVMQWAAEGWIGGVILFPCNIVDPRQLKVLTQTLSGAAPTGRPLLIAVDQEGGFVQRLSSKNGFSDFRSAKQVVAQMSLAQAFKLYVSMAQRLAEHGINLNFGPVVDLDLWCEKGSVIGRWQRSFSQDSQTVVRYAQEFIKAHGQLRVLTTPKHYPGHGSARGDTHKGFVDVEGVWEGRELEPYGELHRLGLLDAVMTAHISNAHVDKNFPATLSRAHLDGLRQKMGFDGVIVSDDLQMGAIQDQYALEEVAEQFVFAGGDLMLFSQNPLAWRQAQNPRFPRVHPIAIADALAERICRGDGMAKELRERIRQSSKRIARWKRSLSLPSAPP